MTIRYHDRGNEYVAQTGITVKEEICDFLPGRPITLYAKGHDIPDYFPCRIDGYGNICDTDGIVVFPSGSGEKPLKRGDRCDGFWDEMCK